MAYNTFYTSIPVLVSVLDKDLSERTVMQHPQILFYCQAGRSALYPNHSVVIMILEKKLLSVQGNIACHGTWAFCCLLSRFFLLVAN